MRHTVAVQWIFRVMAIAVAWAASVPAYAQGCAMCYNDAAAAKSAAIQALKNGTLILLFPVLLMFFGILGMAFRSRNRFNGGEAAALPDVPDPLADALRQAEAQRLTALGSERPVSGWQAKRPAPSSPRGWS